MLLQVDLNCCISYAMFLEIMDLILSCIIQAQGKMRNIKFLLRMRSIIIRISCHMKILRMIFLLFLKPCYHYVICFINVPKYFGGLVWIIFIEVICSFGNELKKRYIVLSIEMIFVIYLMRCNEKEMEKVFFTF